MVIFIPPSLPAFHCIQASQLPACMFRKAANECSSTSSKYFAVAAAQKRVLRISAVFDRSVLPLTSHHMPMHPIHYF